LKLLNIQGCNQVEKEDRKKSLDSVHLCVLFLCWGHELSVDDPEEDVDHQEQEQLPADELVQGPLRTPLTSPLLSVKKILKKIVSYK
jgi:hypothetical protein